MGTRGVVFLQAFDVPLILSEQTAVEITLDRIHGMRCVTKLSFWRSEWFDAPGKHMLTAKMRDLRCHLSRDVHLGPYRAAVNLSILKAVAFDGNGGFAKRRSARETKSFSRLGEPALPRCSRSLVPAMRTVPSARGHPVGSSAIGRRTSTREGFRCEALNIFAATSKRSTYG